MNVIYDKKKYRKHTYKCAKEGPGTKILVCFCFLYCSGSC